MNKLTGLIVTTDDVISKVTFTDDYRSILDLLDAELFEVVSLPGYSHLVLLVDESGLINNKPLNRVGSCFYGYEIHGNPIAGDVVLIWRDGPDLVSMDEDELMIYKKELIKQFKLTEGVDYEQ